MWDDQYQVKIYVSYITIVQMCATKNSSINQFTHLPVITASATFQCKILHKLTMTTKQPFGIDRLISPTKIQLTIDELMKRTSFYERNFLDKLFDDGKLKKKSRCQYSWLMISIYLKLVFMISFMASLFILFNYIPYFLQMLMTFQTSSSNYSSNSLIPTLYILGFVFTWLFGYIFVNVFVYVNESWLLPLYFNGILGDKLLWYNKDLTHSMIAIHPEMLDDRKFAINNISAIRGINGARNNVGDDNRCILPQQTIENEDEDKNNDTILHVQSGSIINNSMIATDKTGSIATPGDTVELQTPQQDEKKNDITTVTEAKTETETERATATAQDAVSAAATAARAATSIKKRLAINATYDSNDIFATRMRNWTHCSVCCSFCAYWVVVIIWVVYFMIGVLNVYNKYVGGDSGWDVNTFEDKLYDETDKAVEQITNADHYQFWAMGLLMTPVWFFVCVTICIYNNFKQEAKKYSGSGKNAYDHGHDLNWTQGSINNGGGPNNNNNNNNNIDTMNQGLLNSSEQQYDDDDDDKNGNVSDKSLLELETRFNFGNLLNDFVSSQDGLTMIVLVHFLLLFTWLIWHWMSSTAVKIRTDDDDDDDESFNDNVNIEIKRNNPLLSYWTLFIFTTLMKKICEYFAGRYDKWKLSGNNDNSSNSSNDINNKYIDVGLEFKHLVNIFIIILYSFGFRFLFTNVKEWQSFIVINIFHCIINILNGSIQSYMKFHNIFNCIKSSINSCLNWNCRARDNENEKEKKEWLKLIVNKQDLTQFNKELAFVLCYKFVISTSTCLIVMASFGIVTLAADHGSNVNIVVYEFISASLLFDCIVFLFEIYFFNQEYNDFFALLLIEYDSNDQLYWRLQLKDKFQSTKSSLANAALKTIKAKSKVKLNEKKEKALRTAYRKYSIYDQVIVFYASKSLMTKIVQREKNNKFLDSKGDKNKNYYGYGRLLFVELVLSWLWIGALTGMPTDAS